MASRKTPGIGRDSATGKWFYVIDVPAIDGKRKQHRKRGFDTKKAAVEARDKARSELAGGTFVDPSTLTVAAYLNDTWLPMVKGTVRLTTYDTYTRLVRCHIAKRLGSVLLQKLDRPLVGKFVTALVEAGLSPKSVRNIHGILAKALADAKDLKLVSENVATRTRALPPAAAQTPRAWSADETKRFLKVVENDQMSALWRFIALTGCRRGEALGLRWRDVDLDAGTATITQQRTIAGGSIVEGAPKTKAGARTVRLDARTVAALKAWKRQQSADKLLMGAGWGSGDLVFTNADGTALWPQRVTERFRKITSDAKLPAIGVHGLRHSAATLMIGSGVNPRVVQQRLGHAHISVTLGLYTHVLPAHDEAAVDALAAALDG